MTPAEAGARSRHPTARWPFDLGRMQQRVAGDLAAEGHPWPHRAAALLALRGRVGLDRARFAALAGVAEDVISAIEEGRRPDGLVPAGGGTGGHDGLPPARPAAGETQ